MKETLSEEAQKNIADYLGVGEPQIEVIIDGCRYKDPSVLKPEIIDYLIKKLEASKPNRVNMSLNTTENQRKPCDHKNGGPYFVEQDGGQVMYQCQSCGEIWWEELSKKTKQKYIPDDLPEKN